MQVKNNNTKESGDLMKNIVNVREKEKGITLIALVITIVVLLILAGITVGTLNKDNGIIKEAKSSKEYAEKAELEQQVEVAIIIAKQKHKNPTREQVIEEIRNNKIIDSEEQVKENGDIHTNLGYVITGKLNDYLENR